MPHPSGRRLREGESPGEKTDRRRKDPEIHDPKRLAGGRVSSSWTRPGVYGQARHGADRAASQVTLSDEACARTGFCAITPTGIGRRRQEAQRDPPTRAEWCLEPASPDQRRAGEGDSRSRPATAAESLPSGSLPARIAMKIGPTLTSSAAIQSIDVTLGSIQRDVVDAGPGLRIRRSQERVARGQWLVPDQHLQRAEREAADEQPAKRDLAPGRSGT